jgi:hypothetical protein
MTRISSLLRTWAFLLVTLYGTTSFAATMTVCPKWVYDFEDTGLGEDGLLNNAGGGSYGEQPAAYVYGKIVKGGVTLASGYLNSSGCFAPVTKSVGTYTVTLDTLTVRPDGAYVHVHRTDGGGLEAHTTSIYLSSGAGADITRSVLLGSAGDTVSNTMAVVAQFMLESHIGIGSTYSALITADSAHETSVDPSNLKSIRLGHSPNGSKYALWKFSTAHEIGHTIQFALFGKLNKDYDDAAAAASEVLCKCDHVSVAAERPHCLQSREEGAAAQEEGWSQFIALDAMNNDTQTDGVFTYYKEVLWPLPGFPEGDEDSPPVKINGRKKYKWLKTHCSKAGYVGTEIDWMGFYFAVHSTTSNQFFFTQFRDTYLQACGGGTCNTKKPTWLSLVGATEALYGLGSGRANHWNDRGIEYGVNQ